MRAVKFCLKGGEGIDPATVATLAQEYAGSVSADPGRGFAPGAAAVPGGRHGRPRVCGGCGSRDMGVAVAGELPRGLSDAWGLAGGRARVTFSDTYTFRSGW